MEKQMFKTRKQLNLEAQKKAKEKYRLARRFSSEEFQRLRQYAGNVLTNVHRTEFSCGVLRIGLLK